MRILPALSVLVASICLHAGDFGRTIEELKTLRSPRQDFMMITKTKRGDHLQSLILKSPKSDTRPVTLDVFTNGKKIDKINLDYDLYFFNEPEWRSKFDAEDEKILDDILDFFGMKDLSGAIVRLANESIKTFDELLDFEDNVQVIEFSKADVKCEYSEGRIRLFITAPPPNFGKTIEELKKLQIIQQTRGSAKLSKWTQNGNHLLSYIVKSPNSETFNVVLNAYAHGNMIDTIHVDFDLTYTKRSGISSRLDAEDERILGDLLDFFGMKELSGNIAHLANETIGNRKMNEEETVDLEKVKAVNLGKAQVKCLYGVEEVSVFLYPPAPRP